MNIFHMLLRALRAFKKKFSRIHPTVEVIISCSALLHNVREFQSMYPNVQFAPVLKSNAYGHGLVEVARIFEREHVPFLIVDSLYEARVLRAAGINIKILVIGYTPNDNIAATRDKKISFTLTSLEQILELSKKKNSPVSVHLKIDTGMHRQGILPQEIPAALDVILKNDSLVLEGMCSHLANAHQKNSAMCNDQIAAWERAVVECKSRAPQIKYFHLANTAGAFFASQIPCNVLRLGIGLYGYNTSPHTKMNLRPALKLETIVSGIKELQPGEHVGYNNSFTTEHAMRIATIPVGYYEGLDRRLSNQGTVLVNDTPCPIIGDISMNITSIDVSHVASVKLGDRVIVISNNPEDKNSEENIARDINEIPYVILARIPQHIRRTIVD